MIFRGFWRWAPVPDSPDNIDPKLVEFFSENMNIKQGQVPEMIKRSGYNYRNLEKTIIALKKEKSGIIFVGAIPAQKISKVERNDMTGKIYEADETWAMALDPQKWNISYKGRVSGAFRQAPAMDWQRRGVRLEKSQSVYT